MHVVEKESKSLQENEERISKRPLYKRVYCQRKQAYFKFRVYIVKFYVG